MQAMLKRFMDSPAGPKTIFFWAPTMKWGLVMAGLADINRPVEKVSVPQNLALTLTGFIWVRYSMVIDPINYNLAMVNFFVGGTGLYQLWRVGSAKMAASSTAKTQKAAS